MVSEPEGRGAVLRPRLQRGFLALAIFIAAVLRGYRLSDWSLWIEESHSLRHAGNIVSIADALRNTRPVFYLILKGFTSIFGTQEWAIRLPAILLGILGVPVLFWIARRLFGAEEGLVSAFLLAVAPWDVFWSQSSRFYVLLLLLFTLAILFYYWGLERGDVRRLILALVFLAVGLATHALELFVVPVIALYFLWMRWAWHERSGGYRWRFLAPLIAFAAAAYALYELILVVGLGEIPVALKYYLLYINPATRSFVGYENPYVMLTSVIYYVGTPLALLSLVAALYFLKQRSRAGLLCTIGAYFPLAAMISLTPFASTANRYVFMSLLFWIMLGAEGLLLVSRGWVRGWWLALLGALMLLALTRDPAVEDAVYFMQRGPYVLGIVLLGVLAFGLLIVRELRAPEREPGALHRLFASAVVLAAVLHPLVVLTIYYAYQHGHRDNWREIARMVRSMESQDDVLLTNLPTVAAYYLDGEVEILGIRQLEVNAVLSSGRGIWYVRDESQNANNRALGAWAEENCDLIHRFDNHVVGRDFRNELYHCAAAGS